MLVSLFFMINDLFLLLRIFLRKLTAFVGFLNNKSFQGRGVDIKEFTINSKTNTSEVEKNVFYLE